MHWPTGSFTSHMARFAEVTCFQGSRYHRWFRAKHRRSPSHLPSAARRPLPLSCKLGPNNTSHVYGSDIDAPISTCIQFEMTQDIKSDQAYLARMANTALFQQPMRHAMNHIRCCSSALVHVTRPADELLQGCHFYIHDRSHATSTLETIKTGEVPVQDVIVQLAPYLQRLAPLMHAAPLESRAHGARYYYCKSGGATRARCDWTASAQFQLLTALGNYCTCMQTAGHATPHIHLSVLCWVFQSLRSADLLINLWHRLSC